MNSRPIKTIAALVAALALATPAWALEVDQAVSFTAPAASLTVPFDATVDESGEARVSFVRVSNIGGVSPDDALGSVPQVAMHIGAWDDACEHVVNVNVCLTLNGTIVIDTTQVRAAIFDPREGSVSVGPTFDLTGRRGIITFTAYATNRDCISGELLGDLLVDDALMGSWQISDKDSTSTFGGNAWGHGLDETGTYVELIEPGLDLDTIYLGTYNPATVTNLVLGLGLRENAGKRAGELGPIAELVEGDSQVCDPTEHCASRPDPKASCLFVSRLDDPDLEALGSSAFFKLTNLQANNEDGTKSAVGSTQNASGSATQVYIVNGEQLAGFGSDTAGYYTLTTPAPPPPEPTPAPTPEPIVCGEGEFEVVTPIEGRTIGCCPLGSDAIVDGSNFIGCQVPGPPTPTPTPVLVPVPTVTTILVPATPTPAPTASPAPTATPTPGAIGP